MKKLVFGIVMVAALVFAFASTDVAFAQRGGNVDGNQAGISRGSGGGMQRAGMGSGLQGTQSGYLHDGMIAFFAETFDLSVDTLNARLAGGETLSQIAIAEGYTADQFFALMADARSAALDQAVADGTITQEQADWMETRGAGGGSRGAGLGRNANPDCPYTTP